MQKQLMTYDDWAMEYKKRNKKAKQDILHKAKQKAMGVALIALSIIAPFVLDGDCTISLLFLPIGIYILISRKELDL